MKKGLALLLTGLLAVTSIPAAAVDIGEIDMTKGTTDWNNPESYVYNNDTGVPDKGLYVAAVRSGDQNKDGVLTVAEAKVTSYIANNVKMVAINALTGVEHFESLNSLWIENTQNDGSYTGGVTDLSPLKDLKNLGSLHFEGNPGLTDLSPLAEMNNLLSLYLFDVVKIRDFSPLKNTTIRSLHIKAPAGSVQSLPDYANLVSTVQGMNNLEWLGLGGFVIPDAAPLLELPHLKNFYVVNCKVEKVSEFSKPAPLEELSLDEISDISWISKFTTLRELSMHDFSQLSTLSALTDLKQLNQLSFYHFNKMNSSLLKSIGIMENLNYFGSYLGEIQDLTEISRFAPNVEDVSLECSSLKGLEEFKNLNNLHIGGTSLTNLNGIEKAANLEFLRVFGSNVSNLNGIEKLTNLSGLSLSENKQLTTVDGIEKLTNLSYLHIGNNWKLTTLPDLTGLSNLKLKDVHFNDNQLSAEELTAKLPKYLQELPEWPEWLKNNADDLGEPDEPSEPGKPEEPGEPDEPGNPEEPDFILPKPGAQEDGSYVVNLDQPEQNDGHRFSVRLPEGMVDESKELTLKVTPQTTSSAAVKTEAEKENCEIQHGFDLSLEYTDGTKVKYTPGKLMAVWIYSPDIIPGRAYRIFRENDDGSVDVIIPSYVGHGIMQFKTDHFSHYSWGIVKNAPVVPDRPSRPSGSSGGSYSYSSRIDENWIFVRSQGMGSVTPGDCTVYDGEDKTFTFMPDEGYKVGKVLLDGEEIPTDGKSYTLRDITAPHTLTVIFARDTADEASKPVDPVKPNVTENAQTGDAWWKLW